MGARSGGDQRWWVALQHGRLQTDTIANWVVTPGCGAVVTFTGTTRDHSTTHTGEALTDIDGLTYEVYEGPALDRMAAIAARMCQMWSAIGRIAVVHRVGMVGLGEGSVLVAVSAPHRPEAFDATRWAIDEIKQSVPVWKYEHAGANGRWADGVLPTAGPELPTAGPAPHVAMAVTDSMADTGGVNTGGAEHCHQPTGMHSEDNAWET